VDGLLSTAAGDADTASSPAPPCWLVISSHRISFSSARVAVDGL
jgi:hypothetical protein